MHKLERRTVASFKPTKIGGVDRVNVAELIEKCGPGSIYYANSTGFYFCALPNSTHVEESKKRFENGEQVVKDHPSVLVCNNIAGPNLRLLSI